MRYPNLRYGNPAEFQHYALGIPLPELARMLRRDERTVRDWLTTRRRVPWWVPELMRLRQTHHAQMLRQMGVSTVLTRLGIVQGEVLQFSAALDKPNSQTPLRSTSEPAKSYCA